MSIHNQSGANRILHIRSIPQSISTSYKYVRLDMHKLQTEVIFTMHVAPHSLILIHNGNTILLDVLI